MDTKVMVEEQEYEELVKYRPQQEGNIILERVLHEGGDLFQFTRAERIRIKDDTYFWELVEMVDGERSMVMNDHPVMRESYRKAFCDFRGDILIGGLGIGLMFSYIKEFSCIDIVEKDARIIKIVGPYFAGRKNVRIIEQDILTFTPAKKYDFVYEDFFWDDSEVENRQVFDAKFCPHADVVRHWEY